jgi:glucose/arabinose dehydrogenase
MLAAALVATIVAAPPPPARLERIATGFDEPVYVTGVPGRPRALAVVERYGRVRLLRPRSPRRRPVLVDLRSRVGIEDERETVDQRGLLSVAFAPDYARSGRIYLDYVGRDGRLRVDEWRRGALRTVLDLGPARTQHHGGQLQFGPDGLLYVSTGMGDDPETSQDPATPGGKILRLDPLSGGAPEVVALGLRNPWRFSFHRGALLIGDVGEDRQEEVDLLPRGTPPGANFGWPYKEGRATLRPGAPAGLRGPALAHRHGPGWCSLVGGYVLRGRFVYGDVCSGRLWSARFRSGRLERPRRLGLSAPYLVSFGRDGRGRVYAVSLGGWIWRVRLSD